MAEEQQTGVMRQAIITIVVATGVLLVLGVVMVFSATAPSAIHYARLNGTSNTFATAVSQFVYAVGGLVIGVLAAFVPMRLYERLALPIFAVGILLQLLVRTPLGHTVAGNTNWLRFGGFSVQPSEFLKLATIVWLAAALARLRPERIELRNLAWPAAASAAGAIGAVLLGGDMGTAMVVALICVGMFWLAGAPGKYFWGVAGAAVLFASVLVAAKPDRLARVSDYLSNLFSLPDGLNPSQSDFALWAFGSGGIGGSGLGTGAEKWPGNLAEAQNDFIFAVVGEELGMGGCLVVVAMFMLLGWGLLRICVHHPARFARLACGGVAIWLCGQALANMLVVTGVLPVFGVPLPFISQGGSAVVACLFAVGVGLSCALAVPGVRGSLRPQRNIAHRARAVLKRGSHD